MNIAIIGSYDESLINSVAAFVESVVSSINYRFPVDLFNMCKVLWGILSLI